MLLLCPIDKGCKWLFKGESEKKQKKVAQKARDERNSAPFDSSISILVSIKEKARHIASLFN
ncbi:hypothetical protein CU052_02560 [Vibrio harveyi]|uniref:Uncharacterized protein n=1 Tax=Vibrio harveyi TaxID=669 RepID=A0A2S0S6S7_VIBHA|nr:hypothetical protein AL538_28320 [Vibrio harveyi]AWA98334.1 hypothetical protein CU052_02560 [Vibrio harveyi]PNM41286.1 hypothetical protein AL469_014470 [Vibrio harveyi]RCR62588.1 hypothetical protein DTW68_14675 [Vibrio harveyi]RIW14902.1 hypothetical protein DS957_008160 [Vibrio harveyi]